MQVGSPSNWLRHNGVIVATVSSSPKVGEQVKKIAAVGVFSLALISIGLGAVLENFGVFDMAKTTHYIRTTEPLLLNAGGETKFFNVLPFGTPLFKHLSFSEGHTTYIVYLNIKGDFASEPLVTDKVNFVDPIWAEKIQKEDVSKLMAETPVSKDDLVRILKARKMTRDDLAQIVRDWKDD